MYRGVLLTALALTLAQSQRSADAPGPVPVDSLPARLSLDYIPLGLAPRPVPKDNPLTEARVQLGRRLFFDPMLSADHTVACASCHQPAKGFSSGQARPRGIGGQQTMRRAPTLFNRAYGTAFFWDGRETSLEEQALRPIEDPREMGARLPNILQRLRHHKEYRARFETAFADGVTSGNLGADRFIQKGETAAMTAQQRHGLWLFESRAGCWRCHSGPNFTDEQFHNTGVSWGHEPLDLGRFAVTRKDADRGKFKTPTLRGVVLTAPYMHDGSLANLKAVVDFYNRGGGLNAYRDRLLAPLRLTSEEVQSLVAFLKAL